MRFVPRIADDVSSIDETALAECLASYPVELAVLFGSRATGEENALSDLDVAVAFERDVPAAKRRAYLDEMTADITRETGVEAVDLVDLDRAAPALGYEILSEGRVLLGDESAAAAREGEYLVRKLDFQPIQAAWQEALRDRIEEGEYGRPR